MRVILVVLAFTLSAGFGHAFENFIPAGTGYSTENQSLPDFNSDQSSINQQTDIYETEIYRKQRKYAEDDARLRQFFSQNYVSSTNGGVDY